MCAFLSFILSLFCFFFFFFCLSYYTKLVMRRVSLNTHTFFIPISQNGKRTTRYILYIYLILYSFTICFKVPLVHGNHKQRCLFGSLFFKIHIYEYFTASSQYLMRPTFYGPLSAGYKFIITTRHLWWTVYVLRLKYAQR